jgi:hypothetical protein
LTTIFAQKSPSYLNVIFVTIYARTKEIMTDMLRPKNTKTTKIQQMTTLFAQKSPTQKNLRVKHVKSRIVTEPDYGDTKKNAQPLILKIIKI